MTTIARTVPDRAADLAVDDWSIADPFSEQLEPSGFAATVLLGARMTGSIALIIAVIAERSIVCGVHAIGRGVRGASGRSAGR